MRSARPRSIGTSRSATPTPRARASRPTRGTGAGGRPGTTRTGSPSGSAPCSATRPAAGPRRPHGEVGEPTDAGTNPPQLSELDRRTDLVTVGIGINDAGYADLLARCATMAQLDQQGAPVPRVVPERRRATPHARGRGRRPKVTRAPAAGRRRRHLGHDHPDRLSADHARDGYLRRPPVRGRRLRLHASSSSSTSTTAMAELRRVPTWTYVSLLGPSEGHDACAGDDQAWVIGAATPARPSPSTPTPGSNGRSGTGARSARIR